MATFGVAMMVDDLAMVNSVIGTFAGIPICYFLPVIFYVKLTKGQGWGRMRLGAIGLAGFGLVAMVLGAYSLLLKL